MGNARLQNSCQLSTLSRSIGEIKDDMQENLSGVNRAFAKACEHWQDKNAKTCSTALEEHNAAMRSALGKLEDFENALNRLSKLASDYKNI